MIASFRTYLVTTLLIFAISSCTLATEDEIAFEQLDGAFAVQSIEFVVFQSALEWTTYYGQHGTSFSAPGPPVDFSLKTVIATYYGLRSGCPPNDKIDLVDSITDEGDQVVVRVAPLPNLGLCEAIVPVWDVVSVDKLETRIVFDPPTPAALN